jgi:hypothetical protein
MDTAHMAIALVNNHWSKRHHANAVIHPVTGKDMESSALVKDPRLQPLWTQGLGNECGRLFQGIQDIPRTIPCFFTTLKNIPEDRKITYVTQARKGMRSAHSRRLQTRLLRRCRHFNSRYHKIQNPNQQHTLHHIRCHDDYGHQELLSRHPATTF